MFYKLIRTFSPRLSIQCRKTPYDLERDFVMDNRAFRYYIQKQTNGTCICFRFHVKDSHCHSFDCQPPECWENVYKVYYAYDVVYEFEFESGGEIHHSVVPIFVERFDECSRIREVAHMLNEIPEGMNRIPDNIPIYTTTLIPSGDGTTWEISAYNDETIEFTLWRTDGAGCRFRIPLCEGRAFGKFLNRCCEYTLSHGEPI